MTFFLRVVRLRTRDEVVQIEGDVASIGSGDEADITLSNTRLAPEHVEIRREGEILLVARTARGRRFPGPLPITLDGKALEEECLFRTDAVLAFGESIGVTLARAAEHPEGGGLAQAQYLASVAEAAERGERVEVRVGVDVRLLETSQEVVLRGAYGRRNAALIGGAVAFMLGFLSLAVSIAGTLTPSKVLVASLWGTVLLSVPLLTWFATRARPVRVAKTSAESATTYRATRSAAKPTLESVRAVLVGSEGAPRELFVSSPTGIRYVGSVPGKDADQELDLVLSRLANDVVREQRGVGFLPTLTLLILTTSYVLTHALTATGNPKGAFMLLYPGAIVFFIALVLPVLAISEQYIARKLLKRMEREREAEIQVRVESSEALESLDAGAEHFEAEEAPREHDEDEAS